MAANQTFETQAGKAGSSLSCPLLIGLTLASLMRCENLTNSKRYTKASSVIAGVDQTTETSKSIKDRFQARSDWHVDYLINLVSRLEI